MHRKLSLHRGNTMTTEEQIAQLEQQIQDANAKFAARRAKINNELRRVRARIAACKRKLDTRRKLLIGAALLAAAETDPRLRKWLTEDFPAHLTSDRDRALFDLPPHGKSGRPAEGRLRRWASRLGDVTPSWLRFRKETS